MKSSVALFLIILVVTAIGLRVWTFTSVNSLLPLNGLYVDEKTYTMNPVIPGSDGFSRPPGMFVMAMITNAANHPLHSRVGLSVLSLLPAIALLLAFRKQRSSWVYICCTGLAFFTLPGPGRNLETGWLLKKTFLILMLPLSLMAMSLGSVRCLDKNRTFWHDLAVSVICAGVISAFVFFPSARFKLTAIPAFWFLSTSALPDRKNLRYAGIAAAGIILISITVTYPGMVRSGLTSALAAEYMIESGNPAGALEELDYAEERGFYGADFHNLTGVSYSLLGYPVEGLKEFEKAIDIAPESPTLWKNYAVSLWTNGKYNESVHAAEIAVNMNTLLRDQLEPILVHAENI